MASTKTNKIQKRRDALKTAILTKKIKNFHKSKIDSLQKLSTRAPRCHDFLHFKGCSYLNHKISFKLVGKLSFLFQKSFIYIIIIHISKVFCQFNFFYCFLGFSALCKGLQTYNPSNLALTGDGTQALQRRKILTYTGAI